MEHAIATPPPEIEAKTTTSEGVVEKRVLIMAASEAGVPRGCYVVKVGGCWGHGVASKNRRNRRSTQSQSQGRKIEAVCRSPTLYFASYACTGSNIYCVGGGPDGHSCTSDVYVAKINRKLEWRMIASMQTRRRDPKAVVVDGKLYVFGGCYFKDGTSPLLPWAEVYNPKKRIWCPLPQPPSFFSTVGLFVVHDPSSESLKTKILVSSSFPSLLLYAYDVISDSWEIIDDNFTSYSRVTCPVLRDNKLYWIVDKVAVYDLHLKQMFTGPIVGQFDRALRNYPSEVGYEPVVLHLDGEIFCIIWLDVPDEGADDLDPICCTTVRISETFNKKNGGKYTVKGYSLSTHRYLVDQLIYSLFAMVLDGTFSAIEESASGDIGEVNQRLMTLAVAEGC